MGRLKGSKNRPVDPSVIEARRQAVAKVAGKTSAELAGNAPNDTLPRRGLRDIDRAADVEILVRKYERGARLLGLMLNDVDRLLGEPEETMSRRKRYTSTGIPLPPAHVALYQRHIPLTEEYLRAESWDDLPDERVLEIKSNRELMILALEKSMVERGILDENEIARTIEFAIAISFFRMSPQEVFDAVLAAKVRKMREEA